MPDSAISSLHYIWLWKLVTYMLTKLLSSIKTVHCKILQNVCQKAIQNLLFKTSIPLTIPNVKDLNWRTLDADESVPGQSLYSPSIIISVIWKGFAYFLEEWNCELSRKTSANWYKYDLRKIKTAHLDPFKTNVYFGI